MSVSESGVVRFLLTASIDSDDAALGGFCLREETESLGYAPSPRGDSRLRLPFLAAVLVSEPKLTSDSGESDVSENSKLTNGDLRRNMMMKMKKPET